MLGVIWGAWLARNPGAFEVEIAELLALHAAGRIRPRISARFSLEQAADLLQRPEANNLSVDINYVDKIVLRTFRFENLPYHLLVICPQAIDERSEVELSIEQIQGVLSHEM
jgi:hypothetical protein